MFCAGGVPIDKRSRRTSVPFGGAGFVPRNKEKIIKNTRALKLG